MISSHLLNEIRICVRDGVARVDSRLLAAAFCITTYEELYGFLRANAQKFEPVWGEIVIEKKEEDSPDYPGNVWLTEEQAMALAAYIKPKAAQILGEEASENLYNVLGHSLTLSMANYVNACHAAEDELRAVARLVTRKVVPDFMEEWIQAKELQCMNCVDTMMTSLIAALPDEVRDKININGSPEIVENGTPPNYESVREWIARMEAIKRYAPEFAVQADLAIRLVTGVRGLHKNPEIDDLFFT